MLEAKPLFSLQREGHEEVCVHGEIVLVGAAGVLFRSSDQPSFFPARSLLKPFQFQATQLGRADTELELPRVAALGSISATATQVSELKRWHGARDLQQQQLQLPAALPLDAAHRQQLLERSQAPSPVFHPCFSKHMAILAACEQWGWSAGDYTAASHPFHAELERVLQPHLDAERGAPRFVRDGCQLLTPVLSSLELARMYRHLAMAPSGSVEARLREAMMAHPAWIGASDRFDTRLMQQNPGRLIAKEGADGLLAIGIGPTRSQPGGVGLLIKLAAGHQPAWAALAAVPFLEQLELEAVRDPTPGQDVVWHARPQRVAPAVWDISPSLDERIAVWPGDTAFSRELVAEIGAPGSGWNLAVSAIRTTVHVGAHADAPNHFSAGGVGIDAVPLPPYRGLCQVIELSKARGSLIVPEDLLELPLRAPRLLFKTGSFPDPRQFNTDFVAFSAELIPWLEARGMILIGIDTPSVDPFSSKSLPTHHATRGGSGVSILEGLDLSQISAGLYELIALPLRLQGADASPVRATLWPLR